MSLKKDRDIVLDYAAIIDKHYSDFLKDEDIQIIYSYGFADGFYDALDLLQNRIENLSSGMKRIFEKELEDFKRSRENYNQPPSTLEDLEVK